MQEAFDASLTFEATARLGRLRLVPAPPEERPEPSPWCIPGVRQLPRIGPSAVVAALIAATDALHAAPPSGRPEDTAELFVLAERLRGLALRDLAELDAVGGHLAAGAATAAVWLRDTALLTDQTARATVRLAGRVRDELGPLGEALNAGGTSLEHVRAVAEETRGLDPEIVRDSLPALCQLVRSTDARTTRMQLKERADAIRPELGRDAALRAHDRRGFFADDVQGVKVLLGGSLGAQDGQVLLLGLDLACEADRTAGDKRTLPQRRADVLVRWAREAASQLAGSGDSLSQDAHTVRTHLLITCTPEQLLPGAACSCVRPGAATQDLLGDGPSLLDGQPPASFPTRGALLPHDALRRLACDATMSLLATDGRTQEPLYVGRSSRTVTGAQFKALVVRDRHCVVRGCRRRPAQCEAHHVWHWLDGGLTELDNLVLLCRQHHHDHHDRGQSLRHRDGRWMTPDGWSHGPP